jgi:hypothetical protein
MNATEFEDFLEGKLRETRMVLATKGNEYAHGDRLSNFKRAAEFLDCTPEKALWGFVSKHIIALNDFIADLEKGRMTPIEQWEEKIGDIRNYMVLLDALVIERLEVANGESHA